MVVVLKLFFAYFVGVLSFYTALEFVQFSYRL